jgi:hypothetical protein
MNDIFSKFLNYDINNINYNKNKYICNTNNNIFNINHHKNIFNINHHKNKNIYKPK